MKCWKLGLLSAICITMASDSYAQDELPQPTLGTIAVRLQPDGLLTGTVGHIDPSSLELIPMGGVSLSFVQNRRVVVQTVSGPNGQLAVSGLSPQAVYSVIGRAEQQGRRWFMAVGVSVLTPEGGEASAALSRKPVYRLTAARARRRNLELMAQPSIGLSMVPEGDLGLGSDDSSAPVLGEVPLGGGGGGGGGGLGGGGLAAAAVAAAVAVAAADDDDARLASPFRP